METPNLTRGAEPRHRRLEQFHAVQDCNVPICRASKEQSTTAADPHEWAALLIGARRRPLVAVPDGLGREGRSTPVFRRHTEANAWCEIVTPPLLAYAMVELRFSVALVGSGSQPE